MTTSELLQYRGILEKKLGNAIPKRERKTIDDVYEKIESIDYLLELALTKTLEESDFYELKTIRKDDIADVPVLQNALKEARIAIDLFNQQEDVAEYEEIEEKAAAPVQKTLLETNCDKSTFFETIEKLLKDGFVRNLPKAIDTYRERYAWQPSVAEAWISISDNIKTVPHIIGWNRSICKKVEKLGPVITVASLKRMFSQITTAELAEMIEAIVGNYHEAGYYLEVLKQFQTLPVDNEISASLMAIRDEKLQDELKKHFSSLTDEELIALAREIVLCTSTEGRKCVKSN